MTSLLAAMAFTSTAHAGWNCEAVFGEPGLQVRQRVNMRLGTILRVIDLPGSIEGPVQLPGIPSSSAFYRFLTAIGADRSTRFLHETFYPESLETRGEVSSVTEAMIPGQTYNLVVTRKQVFIAELDGSLLNNLITKHCVIGTNAPDVIFAGEVMRTQLGLRVLANSNSGTYRPPIDRTGPMEKLFAELDFADIETPSPGAIKPVSLRLPRESELANATSLVLERAKVAELPALLSALESAPRDPSLAAALRERREDLTRLRDLSYLYAESGKPRLTLSVTTHLLGQIGKQLEAGNVLRAKLTSTLLRLFLGTRDLGAKLSSTGFDPALAKGRAFDVTLKIAALLVKQRMNDADFGLLRTSFKKFQAVLLTKQELGPLTGDEALALTALRSVTERLGAMHEETVERRLRGEINTATYDLPDQLRFELVDLNRQLTWINP